MLFSKSCIYGIRAAIYLALHENRRFVPIREISDTLDISFHFLTKILQVLTQTGLIKSEKGPKGGVALLHSSKNISLYDVINTVDGSSVFDDCIMGFPGCSDDQPCSMHKIWKETKSDLQKELQETTLYLLATEIREGAIKLTDVEKNLHLFKTKKSFINQ